MGAPQGKVGLVKVESANCVWIIQALDDKTCSNPLGMVIAYVDDIIAVGEQDQLDGMKAELDKLYVMKTSGFIPSKYDPEVEPLRFLGCLIERIPSGQIIMHQRSYIDHCLKANDMEKLKGLTTLPAVDERSPPEEEIDEDGQTTDYEEHKSWCQKYIGQFMWLATRTRPDISATLGILASQMVIRPKYVHGCLKQLWRYIVGTRELDMTSFEPNDVALGELLLTLYVDALFSTGGGRSRTGIAMYLVNPIDGSESLVQWASRRQTSMATSAPEAEVSAMAEGFAASIFLFDSLKELKLVKGIGPSCILSMKTDSAVALRQLNTQSVTVRSRTAAQKLTYLRELVYQAPQVEPIYYISGQSQRADGQTKILSGQLLREAQRHFNLIPHAELKIQVCYHPSFSPMLVSVRESVDLQSHNPRPASVAMAGWGQGLGTATVASSLPDEERPVLTKPLFLASDEKIMDAGRSIDSTLPIKYDVSETHQDQEFRKPKDQLPAWKIDRSSSRNLMGVDC